jgi:hypothetical protein
MDTFLILSDIFPATSDDAASIAVITSFPPIPSHEGCDEESYLPQDTEHSNAAGTATFCTIT